MDINRMARLLESMRTNCVIWPGYSAKRHDLGSSLFQYYSSRVGGGHYRISQETIDAMEARSWFQHPHVSKRLTTHLLDEWLLDNDPALITVDLLQDIEERNPLPVYTRAERLLQYISRETFTIGDYVHLKKVAEQDAATMDSLESTLDALAWSESEEWGEVEFLLGYLKSNGWVQFDRHDREAINCIVTVDGHSKIAEAETGNDFAQCFVAMWFDPCMDEAYEKGVRPAIEAAGYKPLRIDRREDLLDKIDDAIIAEIRKSKLVVADFTHGSGGVRGGVYYEAGFAKGLGKPVIFLCRKENIDQLHFDTRQFNHIIWGTPDELRERLKNRILASLGEGPELTRP